MRLLKYLDEKAISIDRKMLKTILNKIEMVLLKYQGSEDLNQVLSKLNDATKGDKISWAITNKTITPLDTKFRISYMGTNKDGEIFIYVTPEFINNLAFDSQIKKTVKKISSYLAHELTHRDQLSRVNPSYDFDKKSSGAEKRRMMQLTGEEILAQMAYVTHEHEMMGFARSIIEILRQSFSKESVNKILKGKVGGLRTANRDAREILNIFDLLQHDRRFRDKKKKFLRYCYEINQEI